MFCKNCGSKMPDDAMFCEECGARVDDRSQNNTTASGFNQGQSYSQKHNDSDMSMFKESEYTTDYSNNTGATGNSGKAVASLILGIISLVCCCTGWFGVIFGVVAIGLSVSDGSDTGMAKAGKIMGIIGTALGAILIIYAFMADKSTLDEFKKYIS